MLTEIFRNEYEATELGELVITLPGNLQLYLMIDDENTEVCLYGIGKDDNHYGCLVVDPKRAAGQ